MLPQPDLATCGPTCLHAVYRFHGDEIDLPTLIDEVPNVPTGGTLAVFLAIHALRRGYRAKIYTYNLQLFDPTWFRIPKADLRECLQRQLQVKQGMHLEVASHAYLEYLTLGGEVLYEELSPRLLLRHLASEHPILTGLSATYLYDSARERDDHDDDIGGSPMGHFVVIHGYDAATNLVRLADPLGDNPPYRRRYYEVDIQRVLGSVLLGILTYDANLLVIEPPRKEG